MSIPLGELVNRESCLSWCWRLKLNALPCCRFPVCCQSNFPWHWHSLLGTLLSLQPEPPVYVKDFGKKVPPFVLYNVLLHEGWAQKETRLSEMADAVHSGAHSSKGTLDLLCVCWMQWILSCAPGKGTDPPINNKYDRPEDHVNIHHKREDRILPATSKNAFFVTESFQFQTCQVQ